MIAFETAIEAIVSWVPSVRTDAHSLGYSCPDIEVYQWMGND
jgi:hypothetical protein